MAPTVLQGIRCRVAITILCLFMPLVSSASDYMGIGTPHLVFYFYSQDERLMRSFIDQAEELRREIVGDLGIDLKERTRVYLAPSFMKFQEIQPGREIPSWSVGVAYPSLNLIIIRSPRAMKGGQIDLGKVFKHEFTHIALGRAFRGREKVPRWLGEGLAMYESREWDLSRASAMTRAVLTDSLIPLSDITHYFPSEVNRVELAYSESFYLISFLISRYGRESFHGFIREYSRGKGLTEVLMEVYGISLEELEERWRSYLRLRFSWIPIITSSITLWFLVSIVYILGYLKKRKAYRLRLKELEREDEYL